MSLEQALYAVHDSASIRQVQTAFLRYLPEIIPCRGYGIYQLDPETEESILAQARGATDAFLADYEERGRGWDPLFARCKQEHAVFCSDVHFTSRDWQSFPFFQVVVGGGLERELQAPVVVGGRVVGTLHAARSARDRPFTRATVERMRVVMRHVSLAYARCLRAEEIDRRQSLVVAALDVLSVPLMVTDEEGRSILTNRAADRLLATGPLCAATFDSALSGNRDQLASGDHRVATTSVPLERSLTMTLSTHAATGLTVRSTRLAGLGAIASFVYETTSPVAAPLPILSRRERELVALVVQGLTNNEIAAVASISPNTVKQHLKRVFRKLQVGSRVELAVAVARRDDPFLRA